MSSRNKNRPRDQEDLNLVLPFEAALQKVAGNDTNGQLKARRDESKGGEIEEKSGNAPEGRGYAACLFSADGGRIRLRKNSIRPQLGVHQASDRALASNSAASGDFAAKSFQAVASAMTRHLSRSLAEKSATVAPLAA